MGGKSRAPDPPDYGPIAEASRYAADLSFAVSREQLDWARETYGNDMEIVGRLVDAALRRQEISDDEALRDRERYERIFQPLEDRLAQEAVDFASPERQEYEASRAMSSVAQQFDAQRRAAVQNLESYGIDPSSTRHAALDAGARVAGAAAQAGAGNQARAQTEAIGRALRSEAINVGRGYPGQIAGTYGTALQSGNQAANTQLAGTTTGASTMGTGTQWAGLGNQALAGWGNTLNMEYNNQLAQFQANQQASSGIGGLLGAGLGLIQAFGEGGPVQGAIPVTPGGNVPMNASPSGGNAVDDVPARLTAGEFVIPTDVVQWKGEEFFQRLIDKSRTAVPAASAQPTPAAPMPGPPAFTSRPQGAIPIG